MLRFLGFRASLNFNNDKGSNGIAHYQTPSGVSVTGAYRSSTEITESFINSDPQKRIRPSMVKIPNLPPAQVVKPSKSSNDLVPPKTEPTNTRHSSAEELQTNNNNIALTKSQIKEQKNLEKRRLAEQQKRDKLAAQEQIKRDKLAKDQQKRDRLAAQEQQKREKQAALEQQKREKQAALEQQKRDKQAALEQQKRDKAAQEQLKRDKLSAKEQQKRDKTRKEPDTQQPQTSAQDKRVGTKRSAPSIPAPVPPNPPPFPTNPLTQRPTAYSTNTLESSISKSSGPPPYTAEPEVVPSEHDDTGNTSFVKRKDDSGSWDMISQHRQQLHRPPRVGKPATKQTHLDLHYNVEPTKASQDNSEA